jgi:glycerol-3-phosphate dehydrogenase (NAD(P)+)
VNPDRLQFPESSAAALPALNIQHNSSILAPCYNPVMTGATRLAVVGAGAWGTVLAQLLAQNGQQVTLWTRTPEQAAELAAARENMRRLPGLELHASLRFTARLDDCVAGCAAAFIVVPSTYLPAVLEHLPPVPAFVSCSKGFGASGLERLSSVIQRSQRQARPAALSGPNLAAEIARHKPSAAVVASPDADLARSVQRWLQQPSFRVYSSSDMAGVEIGGAMKNIIALAAGMCAGLQLGENTKAAIITRGLHEIARLGVLLGGQRETFYGLSGLGDLVATCAGTESRNFTAGLRLGRGEQLADLQADRLNAEGIVALQRVHAYAVESGIDLPITREVQQVIFEGKPAASAIRQLMERSSKAEADLY